ncbi:general stress protein [Actinoplanes sp. NPDC049316]|uniref:general stress protein n=1 Tax=Actinoplanes sp. NPDC049316 TaxID=3154727 RepID=UPI00341FEDF1
MKIFSSASPSAAPAQRAPSSAGAGDVRVGLAQRVIAVHGDHAAAEATVRLLDEAGFPVHRAAIVGRGLTTMESANGWMSSSEVAGRGALSGVAVGALTGWILAIVDLVDPTVSSAWLVVNAAILGAVLGAAIGLIGYAATRGRRSITTEPKLVATHYDVQVDAELADRAVRLLESERPAT